MAVVVRTSTGLCGNRFMNIASKAGYSQKWLQVNDEESQLDAGLLKSNGGHILCKISCKISRLFSLLVKSKDCPHEHASTICAIFLFTPLLGMVAYSIFARYKDHRRRASSTGEDAIMASATGHSPNQALLTCGVLEKSCCCCLDAVNCLWLEFDGFRVEIRLYTSILASLQCR